jgi:hypothetical protein
MLELGNASDSSDEYETSSVDVPKSPSCDPGRLKGALVKLAETFRLDNEQIEALPALSEVSLIEQDDSHLIFSEDGYRDAHAFKLYVGNKKWAIDGKKQLYPAFAYLFKKASKRKGAPFKMQICNGSIGEGTGYPSTPSTSEMYLTSLFRSTERRPQNEESQSPSSTISSVSRLVYTTKTLDSRSPRHGWSTCMPPAMISLT